MTTHATRGALEAPSGGFIGVSGVMGAAKGKKALVGLSGASDYGPLIVDPQTGEFRYAIPLVIEDVATGTRATVKRGRRREAWEGINGLTRGMHLAALAYRQAWEHCQAGKAMGPMPWGGERQGFAAFGARLLPQERAVSAATVHRVGVQAMGLAASQGVVQWVVIQGRGVEAFDVERQRRKGVASAELVAALERLAKELGCE
jgi:hypothetical protein